MEALWEKARLLQLWVEVSSSCCMERHVADQIMPACAVAPAAAAKGVVSEGVEDTITARTFHVSVGKGHSEPTPEHGDVEARVVI